MKSRRVRWARHVAHREEGRNVYSVFVGKLRERDRLEVRDLDGRMTLHWFLKGIVFLKARIEFIWLRRETSDMLNW